MAQVDPYYRQSGPFNFGGKKHFVAVEDSRQTVRLRNVYSKDIVDETICCVTRRGCAIEEITASPSGSWLATQRISGAGEWGYDVFTTRPLLRVAGIDEEGGYMLDLPQFAADETQLALQRS